MSDSGPSNCAVAPVASLVPSSEGAAGEVEIVFASTSTGYQTHIKSLISHIGADLDAVDPTASLLTVIQFPGPIAQDSSGSMRIELPNHFLRSTGDDLGLGWTLAGHFGAWEAMAAFAETVPAYARRVWSFDMGIQPVDPKTPDEYGMSTNEQEMVAVGIEEAHPGLWLKNEHLAARYKTPTAAREGGMRPEADERAFHEQDSNRTTGATCGCG